MTKQDRHAIDEAESRAGAEAAFDRLAGKHGAKHDKAVACLAKDRAALPTFDGFPAARWKHVRSSNPIESAVATVRLRTDKTKGRPARGTALALAALPTSRRGIGRRPMVFRLATSAERHWRRLDGSDRLAQLIGGVSFRDGAAVRDTEERAAA